MITQVENIYRRNKFEYELTLEEKLVADGTVAPPETLTDGVVFISTTYDDAAVEIDSTLSLPLVERTGAPGVYYAVFSAAVLEILFPAYNGKAVYVIAQSVDGQVRVVTKVKVFGPRLI